ncbi:MAG: histidine phosphatase family protein [Rhodocyclaceae bacterium]|nr:histidine phosphatase family protein [Rhodocyclaceae bacterium]MBX3667393.1 histidine phosphatase family protein [Rhodocyclaceae bacterium]
MHLYLIRHPRPDVPPGVCYGVTDLALLDDPELRAERIRIYLPAGTRVATSPLQRARLLAEALDASPIVDARLAELDFGDWEMCPISQLPPGAFETWRRDLLEFSAPNGESMLALAERVWQAYQALSADQPESLAIVAHGGPLRVIAGRLLGMPSTHWLGLDFACGRSARLDIEGPHVRLAWFNR